MNTKYYHLYIAQGTGKCIDYEYAGFHCVPIYQCNNDGVIRTAAQGLFDPRYSVQVLNNVIVQAYISFAQLV